MIRNDHVYLACGDDEWNLTKSICLIPAPTVTDPTGSGALEVLRRFDGLSPVGVHGLYDPSRIDQCPNGKILASSIEVELD